MSTGKIAAAAAGAALALVLAVAAGCAAPTGPVANTTSQKIKEKTQSREASVNAAIEKAQGVVSSVAAQIGTEAAQDKAKQINASLKQLEDQLTEALHATGDAKTKAVTDASATFESAIKEVDDAAKAAPPGSAKQTALNNFSAKLRSAQAQLAAAAAAK